MTSWWDSIGSWTNDRKKQIENEANEQKQRADRWIKETTQGTQSPNVDDGAKGVFTGKPWQVQFGNDKTPIQVGFEGTIGRSGALVIGDLIQGKDPLQSIGKLFGEGGFQARVGGFGVGASIDPRSAAKGKFPIGFDVIYPEWSDPNKAIRDPRWRSKFGIGGIISNFFDPSGRPLQDKTYEDQIKQVEENNRKKRENAPIGGFTVPKGVLGADTGVYAAVLNGKQGFLDKASGKWSEYGNLTPEQKSRLASDFINDPKELAKALPTGSYSAQNLYLPEFQPVRLAN